MMRQPNTFDIRTTKSGKKNRTSNLKFSLQAISKSLELVADEEGGCWVFHGRLCNVFEAHLILKGKRCVADDSPMKSDGITSTDIEAAICENDSCPTPAS
eukprot:2086162-Amphidinium_carterae.1